MLKLFSAISTILLGGFMQPKIKLLDGVALVEDLPELGLYRGQVGTVVEIYEQEVAFEVEFVDPTGDTYAMETLKAQQLMLLHRQPLLISA
jgi:hypothetical protein